MAKTSRVARRPIPRRAALTLVGAAVPLCWQLALPAAAGTTGSLTVADRAEAWYAAAPVDTCTTPLGCPPAQVPTSPYPAGTLHVGLAGGRESARTYVVPDLAKLPVGATAATGTMTLPVASDTQSGTQSPDKAAVKACLVTSTVHDGVQGATSTPPTVDCSLSVAVVYVAAKNVFTVDLTTFLGAWSTGKPQDGIALVPDTAKAAPSDAWHVAFNGRKRAGVAHIGSAVTFTTSSAAGSPPSIPPNPHGGSMVVPTAAPPPAPQQLSLPPAAATPQDPGAAAPQVAGRPPTTVVARPVAFSRGFQYPMAFLAPLALLAGAVFLARLFTRDATPLGLRR